MPTAPPPRDPAMSTAPALSAEAILAAEAMRVRAERLLAQRSGKPAPSPGHPFYEMQRQQHELLVHQIELEMQNEDLRAGRALIMQAHEQLADLYDQAPVGYLSLNEGGVITRVNQVAARLLGVTKDNLLTQPLSHFIDREDQDVFYLLRRQTLRTDVAQTGELRLQRPGGEVFWAELIATRQPTEAGEFVLRVTLSDFTERHAAREKLGLAASVFANSREGIMITDASAQIVQVNAAFTRITGYSDQEVVGQNPRLLSSGRHGAEFHAAMWQDLQGKGHWYGEVWNRRKNGEVYAELQTVTSVRNTQGQVTHYVALFSDITRFKAQQAQLEHIAHYDVLTNLPNRALLADRLHQSMAQTLRRGDLLGVAYLDLDGFKTVNDQHGHAVGDQLLVALAARMKEALRDGDTLARLGGDEFVAVLTDLPDAAASLPLLQRLLDAASLPFQVGALSLQISASVGVSFYPQAEPTEPDQLLRQADQAMYQAKQAGKNCFHLFDMAHDRNVRGLHEGVQRVRLALTQHELVLHYQPKVNMRSGQVVGAEALIRWQHPQRGLLAPAEFLPLIEDHALAIEVGEWVLNTALTQMALWQQGGLALQVSVNVGALQLQQSDFMERLHSLLTSHPQVQPASLQLEVLETSALKDIGYAAQVIEDCRQLGVTFALDDFGTGYSSLTYLRRLRVAQLKIDQSFVRDMLNNPDDLSILQGIIGLAAAFGREVIAEGVETVAHGTALLQLGCELAQGYGIARPMPAADLPDWINRWCPDASWQAPRTG
ncbi:MAG: EAL domain-containing protein [Rhodoferax sp.]|jgi:diguanylate cyclase (GGDEF)-like protein/PAS domain S-box-containing protein|uniref:putative bifunctional diguanylate cyclase/phosphodiesterase n=1 Tax=Rhodoferax sp. TaxID=50421 RepID=UPI001B670B7D|nr:EAL domain-containing protein [Rhodoferax sp.]MBP9147651.1 EAL domain-containing protein [Rhodoferax sp.]MBP9737050.1 EAL domain-containing protein [Rhodoferax sp.]